MLLEKNFLNFKISKSNDIIAFFRFWEQSDNNKERLLSYVNVEQDQVNEDFISKFIDDRYKAENDLIKRCTKNIESAWIKKERFFLSETAKLFNDENAFLKGIIATPSVWPIYGRFFKEKFITFPYNEGADDGVFVIAHELLHIIFYNYIYTKYKFSEEKMRSRAVWDFSEVINVIIQNQPVWIENFKIATKPYLQHVELHKEMKKLWERKSSVDYLIDNFL